MIKVFVKSGRLCHVADQQQIGEGAIQALKPCPQLGIRVEEVGHREAGHHVAPPAKESRHLHPHVAPIDLQSQKQAGQPDKPAHKLRACFL